MRRPISNILVLLLCLSGLWFILSIGVMAQTDSITSKADPEQVTTEQTKYNIWQNDWSPAGDQIITVYSGAYSNLGLLPKIDKVQTPSKGMIPLTEGKNHFQFPQFSPSGSRIAFTGAMHGNFDIYIMNRLNKNALTQVTTNSGFDWFPTWGPHGNRLAFSSFRNGRWDLYLINLKQDKIRQLTSNRYIEKFPRWSPSGSNIVYVSYWRSSWDLYMYNFKSGEITRLLKYPSTETTPCWFPNSSKIAFASNKNGDFDIYSINTSGTNLTLLVDGAGQEQFPSISPDGTTIIFSRKHGKELWQLEIKSLS